MEETMSARRPTLDIARWTRLALLAGALLAGAPDWSAAQTWSYKDAARPFAGRSITVLDEVTPLQESMRALVPEFEKETGIKVDYQLLNHFEVISKGQADLCRVAAPSTPSWSTRRRWASSSRPA
jgi:ABC-type glycerol-3-phosphate transport system substrate-binding protein